MEAPSLSHQLLVGLGDVQVPLRPLVAPPILSEL
jgi:hypothetical protein